ncbi:hypothetical protein [Bradyrhizobium sp. CW1]|nr:hypothetical protein [Bradyrhizobium sp. CW1]
MAVLKDLRARRCGPGETLSRWEYGLLDSRHEFTSDDVEISGL